jgi:hypothetical protein
MSTHWGLGFIFLLPYLRLKIAIPCPTKLDLWVMRNLHGKNNSYDEREKIEF